MHKRLDLKGGTEKDLYRTAEGLRDLGHDVHLFCGEYGVPPPRGVLHHHVAVIPFGRTLRLWSFAMHAPKVVAAVGCDVVVSFGRSLDPDILRSGGGTHLGFLKSLAKTGGVIRRCWQRISPYHLSLMVMEKRQFRSARVKKIIAVSEEVKSDILANYAFVDHVSGFDVSPFNALSTQHLPVHGTMTSWRRLSQDTDLVRIDLTEKEHKTGTHRLSISVLEDGVAVGIVQWMSVDLAEGIAFSNHPDDYSDGGWLQVLHTFPQPISVVAGEHLDVIVGYDRNSLIVMPVPSPNDDRSKMTPGGLNRRDA